MFGLFKKKTEKERLQTLYERLLKEAYSLSATDRKQSDQKMWEANQVLKKLEVPDD